MVHAVIQQENTDSVVSTQFVFTKTIKGSTRENPAVSSAKGKIGCAAKRACLLDSSRCRPCIKPGLHSIRRTYATKMRKRIYASHARRGVYTPLVDLDAYTQTSTQYRLRTISGRWIYFICRVKLKACVYIRIGCRLLTNDNPASTRKRRRIVVVFTLGT